MTTKSAILGLSRALRLEGSLHGIRVSVLCPGVVRTPILDAMRPEMLDKMLAAIRLTPDDAYITNVLKCRTPQNRRPQPDELEPCSHFWKQQIKLVQPQLIITLGSVASQVVLDTSEPMTTLRGQWGTFGEIPVLPTYHPAYLLRNEQAKRLGMSNSHFTNPTGYVDPDQYASVRGDLAIPRADLLHLDVAP